MIGEIILCLVFLIGVWLITNDNRDELIKICSFLIGVMICTSVIFITLIYGIYPNNYNSFDESQDIYSLQRSTHTQGSFVLGTGTISSKPAYYFHTKQGEAYTLDWVVTNRHAPVKIVEDNRTPQYTRKMECSENLSLLNWFTNCTRSRTLYVPKGTVHLSYRAGTSREDKRDVMAKTRDMKTNR